MVTSDLIRQSLQTAHIPGVSGVIVKHNKVFITVEIDTGEDKEAIKIAILKALENQIDKTSVEFIFTNKNLSPANKKKHYINGIRKLILVASGKGGVGKSTIAVSLARDYQAAGYKVGLVDADIYGPSIPTMFKAQEKPQIVDNKFIPIDVEGIKLMSVGFLVDFDSAIAWRGPMASKILYQMLSTTAWGDLDYLIVDMPPGTGDVHLSILENYHIDGVVIVTTPQTISMIDVDRAMNLYHKFAVPFIALVENMCDLFPGNAGKILSEKYKVENLQHIPFDRTISDS